MSNDEPADKRIFQAAFKPGDCPPIEQLEKLLVKGSAPPAALGGTCRVLRFLSNPKIN